MSRKHSAGKGDSYRKVDRVAWESGWEAAFGSKGSTPKRNSSKRKNGGKRNPPKDSAAGNA